VNEPANPARRKFLLGRTREPVAVEEAAHLMVRIAPSCLAFRGIACMACRDACPSEAIRFALAIGGSRPRVVPDACTGCGECLPVCPAEALALEACAGPGPPSHD
jgi:ferredoxin-type protein NapF